MRVNFDVDHGVVLNRQRLCSRAECKRVTVSVAPQIERKVDGTVRVWSGPPTAENAADERHDDSEAANEEGGAELNI